MTDVGTLAVIVGQVVFVVWMRGHTRKVRAGWTPRPYDGGSQPYRAEFRHKLSDGVWVAMTYGVASLLFWGTPWSLLASWHNSVTVGLGILHAAL